MKVLLLAVSILGVSWATELRIIVYDRANLNDGTRRSTLESLERIFRKSGIQIDWTVGSVDAAEASLITYPATPPRGREREVSCAARRDIALEILDQAPRGFKNTVLGAAQPLAREGLNVRIFNDRVLDTAIRDNRSHPAVLAHVIAHEIGHVLLRSTEHGKAGLMSAAWSQQEYGRMSAGLLLFDEKQARIMERELTAVGCGTFGQIAGAQSTQSPVAVK